MHFLEPGVVDVRVDLRSRDTRVAEQFLHLPEVGTTGKQMRGKTVPERMRTDLRWDANPRGILLEEFPNPLAAQTRAAG